MTAGEDRMKLLKVTTRFLLAIVLSSLAFCVATSCQVPATPRPPKGKIKIKEPKAPIKGDMPPNIEMGTGTTTERSIAVDPKVSLALCITEGNVKINGWKRSEVRAFVENGSKFAFRVLEKSSEAKPVLISIVGIRELENGSTECIAGGDIELDVPESAAIALKGRETDISIDTVRKISAVNVGGDISVRNVAEGVSAQTGRGVITVQNSRGAMTLSSSSGNVVAYSVSPADVGDQFKAKTNSGSISLEKLGYRLADATSISGSVLYAGALLSGGSLSFSTTNGTIRLVIPQDSSCRITAAYGFGSFNSELPFKGITENITPGPVKTVNAVIGSGESIVRLTTNSGSIAIKKLP